MNDADPDTTLSTHAERDALVLEYQRITARLAREGILSSVSATRLMRGMNHQRAKAEEVRFDFSKTVLAILRAVEDGVLKDGIHYRRGKPDFLAIHLEDVALAMTRTQRLRRTARDLRRLFRFGAEHFPKVVVARSARVMFGPDDDRRRAVVLDLAHASEFVGCRPLVVPPR